MCNFDGYTVVNFICLIKNENYEINQIMPRKLIDVTYSLNKSSMLAFEIFWLKTRNLKNNFVCCYLVMSGQFFVQIKLSFQRVIIMILFRNLCRQIKRPFTEQLQ